MELNKKPTRDGFGEGLVVLGEKYSNVVVLSADLTDSTRANWFREKFPDRFISMGIAEQDAVGTAAGLALCGKIPIFATFSIFASGRAWEQVRTTICYSNLNVKIGGSHSGISVGADGPTHQALEEIALMRVIPRMTVICPADYVETKKATIASVESCDGPCYIRFGRAAVPVLTREDDPFIIGKANELRSGDDITIIACGAMTYEALKAARTLEEKGVEARVLNLHTIKPIDTEQIIKAAKETGAILTVEEHQLMGGMGSAVAEVVVRNCPVPMDFIGINDVFGESGSPDKLMEFFGLTANNIVDKALGLLKLKG